jgi:predicted alpha/beta superfamily hydrolase
LKSIEHGCCFLYNDILNPEVDKMKKKVIVLLTVSWITMVMLCSPGFSQEMKVKDGRYSVGDVITLESKILKEKRTLFVYCPMGYETGSGAYPVLYVLDGDARFPYAASIVQFLTMAGRIPEFIVVALSNGPRRSARGRDMTPPESPGQTSGVPDFQLFMEKELFPFIEKKFRTQSYRVLFGHSLAGLYSLYTLFTKPALFDAYIASSPSVMYREETTLKAVREKLADGAGLKKFLYLTVGDEPRYVPAIEKVTALLREKQAEGLKWSYVPVKGEHHRSMPLKALYNGLEALFAGYDMPSPFEIHKMEIDDLRRLVDGLGKTRGFQIRIPEMIVNYGGYIAMQQGNIEKALEYFNFNVEMYPTSPNAYDSLAECLEKKGDMEGARKNFEKAVAMAEKKNHPMLEDFKKNLQRFNKKSSK